MDSFAGQETARLPRTGVKADIRLLWWPRMRGNLGLSRSSDLVQTHFLGFFDLCDPAVVDNDLDDAVTQGSDVLLHEDKPILLAASFLSGIALHGALCSPPTSM